MTSLPLGPGKSHIWWPQGTECLCEPRKPEQGLRRWVWELVILCGIKRQTHRGTSKWETPSTAKGLTWLTPTGERPWACSTFLFLSSFPTFSKTCWCMWPATLFILKYVNVKLTTDTWVYPGAEANCQSNPTCCMLGTRWWLVSCSQHISNCLLVLGFKLLTKY